MGCYTAAMLAQKGFRVSLFEEHPIIGKPVQCTGIVTDEIDNIFKLEKGTVINKIKVARIHSSKSTAEFPVRDYVIDRAKFDQNLANMAEHAGVQVFTSHRYQFFSGTKAVLKDIRKMKTITANADILIGADGPRSDVAKSAGIYGERRFLIGMQARISGRFDANVYDAYIGRGYFCWVVPESRKIARVGVLSKNAQQIFPDFLLKTMRLHKANAIDYQGGLVPLYSSSAKLQAGHLYLAGDAALQAKPTTGGGIVPGLRAARILANSIRKDIPYEKELRPLKRELLTHMLIRKAIDNMDDDELDRLVSDAHDARHVFSYYGRDSSGRLLARLLVAKPSLFLYARKLLY